MSHSPWNFGGGLILDHTRQGPLYQVARASSTVTGSSQLGHSPPSLALAMKLARAI